MPFRIIVGNWSDELDHTWRPQPSEQHFAVNPQSRRNHVVQDLTSVYPPGLSVAAWDVNGLIGKKPICPDNQALGSPRNQVRFAGLHDFSEPRRLRCPIPHNLVRLEISRSIRCLPNSDPATLEVPIRNGHHCERNDQRHRDAPSSAAHNIRSPKHRAYPIPYRSFGNARFSEKTD